MCVCTPSRRTPWCRDCPPHMMTRLRPNLAQDNSAGLGTPGGIGTPAEQLPAGTIEDPRGWFDFLYADKLITGREYSAGKFYKDRCVHAPTSAYERTLLTNCDEALKRRGAFCRIILRGVLIDGIKVDLESDIKLLRTALSYLAMHIDELAAQLERNERALWGDTSAAGPGPG